MNKNNGKPGFIVAVTPVGNKQVDFEYHINNGIQINKLYQGTYFIGYYYQNEDGKAYIEEIIPVDFKNKKFRNGNKAIFIRNTIIIVIIANRAPNPPPKAYGYLCDFEISII